MSMMSDSGSSNSPDCNCDVRPRALVKMPLTMMPDERELKHHHKNETNLIIQQPCCSFTKHMTVDTATNTKTHKRAHMRKH